MQCMKSVVPEKWSEKRGWVSCLWPVIMGSAVKFIRMSYKIHCGSGF